jgi:hypothetical protein
LVTLLGCPLDLMGVVTRFRWGMRELVNGAIAKRM